MDNNYEGFDLKMAIVDCIPVIAFAVSTIYINTKLSSILFGIGLAICIFAGSAKVMWKVCLALFKKDIQFFFKQMRITMPTGFLIMIIAVILKRKAIDWPVVCHGFFTFPALIFFVIGIVGICFMIYFAKNLDPNDAKSNWIEQITNSIAQLSFMIWILFSL